MTLSARSLAMVMLAASYLFGTKAAQAEMRKVAHSMEIEEVKSSRGVTAWLVSVPDVPLIALRFAFEGGSSQDPDDKPGVANFLTTMLDEGADNLDAAQFQERMEDIAMRMGFSEGRDAFYGSLQTLSENKTAAFELLTLALTKPRFDTDALERMRKQLLTNLAFAAKNPNRIAQQEWWAKAYPNHPYGRPASGTTESVTNISAQDLSDYRNRIFAKASLKVAVVGDITAEELKPLLDKTFGDLPAEPRLKPISTVKLTNQGKTTIVEMPFPQSVVVLGMEGIPRDDPDFIPAYVMNHLLGGGGFSSRLMQEVREKRGLAYSVSSHLVSYENTATLLAFVATKNEKVAQSIDVIRNEMRRFASGGVTEEELEDAKSYLTGSYPLRFDTNSKIAQQLLAIQMEKLDIDYVNVRNDMINAIKINDIKRLAERLLKADTLTITMVGQPQNISQNPEPDG